MSAKCPVDHEERRQMGLLGCYHCRAPLQSIEEANAIRLRLGKDTVYGADKVSRRTRVIDPTCTESGMTTFTFVTVGNPAVFAESTATDFTEVNGADAADVAMMAEAERDFDEGRGAPVERVFANVRRPSKRK